MSQPAKVDGQLAYILHTQPYRETSLLVEILTAEHGRFTVMARGARRPRADLRGVLLPFQPLTLAWFGKNELRTLHRAEWNGGIPQLSGLPLICGFYLNELMLKLTARDNPEPEAFHIYDTAVRGLTTTGNLAAVLRRYELRLLQTLGYAPSLQQDQHGEPIQAEQTYRYANGGLACDNSFSDEYAFSGANLLAIDMDNYTHADTRLAARRLMRLWLDHLLGTEMLTSRKLLAAINSLAD
ncbi:DNA repair protein RecO [Neisseriaceae bacterium TC5R-5]|nr:DNA repair protein RecO [Neisseriaceae bacterium TC5R-5]